ncbi:MULTISPECIES: RidA family protein [unclassified Leptolyngbya]|uniref:RidA family protein n=1 Tax=unclassified Leptolyngbya TaxID=2650499 RepID=UPI001681E496|nr:MULTISPECIES: RidA family protein [unclassified Leptolyngbya]MBD1910862.1 RidA family protein [Leptolyngbya sp. FACHB-8]MBD2153743.1 RidA family protein [Leptolyngbya sp. FACHB-16]
MERQNFSTGTPWESLAGYSRAVRVGPFVYVSGTTASDASGQIQHPGDLYGQAIYIYQKIEGALKAVGASLQDVVRTRVYVTNMDEWQQATRAHHEVFQDIRPANTLVEVSRLATPDMLVEIEVDAYIMHEAQA